MSCTNNSPNDVDRVSLFEEVQNLPSPPPISTPVYYAFDIFEPNYANNSHVRLSPPPFHSVNPLDTLASVALSPALTFVNPILPTNMANLTTNLPAVETPTFVPMLPPPAPVDQNTGNLITPPLTPVATRGRPKTIFKGASLEEAVRVAIEVNPFAAKHGEKGKAWKEVAKRLKANGHFSSSSVETIKNKVLSLIAYQEVSINSLNVLSYTLTEHLNSRILTRMLGRPLLEK